MIISVDMLRNQLSAYGNPDNKIGRMVKQGQLYPIKRGFYETDKDCPVEALAGILCNPSYISFESALSHYGLIPEKTQTVMSACFRKNRTKTYSTLFGSYIFQDIPVAAYPYGIKLVEFNQYVWSIAVPEKALCDLLYVREPQKNYQQFLGFLFEGMRIDEDLLMKLNTEDLLFLCDRYQKRNLRYLKRFVLTQMKSDQIF